MRGDAIGARGLKHNVHEFNSQRYLAAAGKLGVNDSPRGTRGQLVGGPVEVQVVNV
jgi:hypothetical protein